MTAKKESRRSRRIRIKIPLTYRLEESIKKMVSIDTDIVKAETANVSVLGASIVSPYVLPPGIKLHIELDRKPFVEGGGGQAEPIRTLARVVGIRSDKKSVRLSVMFDDIEESDKKLIASFVERNLK